MFSNQMESEHVDLIDTMIGIGKRKGNDFFHKEEEFGELFESAYCNEQINEREYTVSKIDEKVWEKYPV